MLNNVLKLYLKLFYRVIISIILYIGLIGYISLFVNIFMLLISWNLSLIGFVVLLIMWGKIGVERMLWSWLLILISYVKLLTKMLIQLVLASTSAQYCDYPHHSHPLPSTSPNSSNTSPHQPCQSTNKP